MAKRSKAIHMIIYKCDYGAYALCFEHLEVVPIEALIKRYYCSDYPKGTFNPNKVTCKRCLKSADYKTAMDKIDNPLFYWRERI